MIKGLHDGWRKMALAGAVVISLVLASFDAWSIRRLSDRIDALGTAPADQVPELTTMDYYKTHDVSDRPRAKLFDLSKDRYLIYFYAPGCSACTVANEYVAAFIKYGFTHVADIYFVDVSRNPELSGTTETPQIDADHFTIAYTPTLLYFKADGTIDYCTGADKVYETLDGLVPR